MLLQERVDIILGLLKKQNTVTVTELVQLLNASESTVRRDLNDLAKKRLLHKVFGGAVALGAEYINRDRDVVDRKGMNIGEKVHIAKYAASLIEDDDFVYLDAGTTTECMIEFLDARRRVRFATNGISHERKMKAKGFDSFLIGGELKLVTEALVGNEATENLRRFRFSKGFFGVNSVDAEYGLTTPDSTEAAVKREAMCRTREPFILADSSKFCEPCAVSFGDVNRATIITGKLPEELRKVLRNVVELGE